LTEAAERIPSCNDSVRQRWTDARECLDLVDGGAIEIDDGCTRGVARSCRSRPGLVVTQRAHGIHTLDLALERERISWGRGR